MKYSGRHGLRALWASSLMNTDNDSNGLPLPPDHWGGLEWPPPMEVMPELYLVRADDTDRILTVPTVSLHCKFIPAVYINPCNIAEMWQYYPWLKMEQSWASHDLYTSNHMVSPASFCLCHGLEWQSPFSLQVGNLSLPLGFYSAWQHHWHHWSFLPLLTWKAVLYLYPLFG